MLTYPSEEEGQGGREGGRKGGREGGGGERGSRREGERKGGREGGRRRRRRDKFHVFMSAVKMARLVNLISHYVVDIS